MNKAINTPYQLQDEFIAYNRGDQFSYYGFEALFDYLTEYEESTGEDVTIDVIGLCCEFTEYESEEELISEYDQPLCDIEAQTFVISLDNGGFLIQDF